MFLGLTLGCCIPSESEHGRGVDAAADVEPHLGLCPPVEGLHGQHLLGQAAALRFEGGPRRGQRLGLRPHHLLLLHQLPGLVLYSGLGGGRDDAIQMSASTSLS